ncbi:MAG: D-sedoheptulose 7-phosphate isomerase [Tunicatimonas sp.]
MKQHIIQELQEAAQVLQRFLEDDEQQQAIEAAAREMVRTIRAGGKIISCGNGGSHCDAMHFAEELSGRYRADRRALPAIAISDVSHVSCVGNDYGFDSVFSRFVEGLGQPNDLLLAISTSGNSANVLAAARAAHDRQMRVVALTGRDGGQLAALADVEVRVAHFGFADRIQEIHIKVIHILIMLIEQEVATL